MPLADDQIDRYSRQILLREIGARGQECLLASSVAIAGGESLAYLCALYLAGAGIGRIALIDLDPPGSLVEPFSEDLSQLNPDVQIERVPLSFRAPRISHLAPFSAFDVLVDACTSASVTTELAAAAAASGRPFLAGGVHGARGWLARHGVGGACAVCVSLQEAGAATEDAVSEPSPVGVVASLLAFETLAALLGWEEDGASWLHYDGTAMSLKTVRFTAHPDCIACRGNS